MTETEKQIFIIARTVFLTDSGKKMLEHLSDYCFEKRSVYVEGNHDKQNVNNGMRKVILHIRDLLERDLDEKEPIIIKEQNYI